ncbi:MAG: efflux RND transporter permease subunit [Paludibaculum sp.]
MAILVVYIVLGVLYESYIHPLTILSGLPSAGFGALLTLYIFHMDLNIYAFVGLIMLIGIVKKNAIMQINFALDAERHQGMSPGEAIYQGCLISLPAHHDDHHGRVARDAVPIAIGYGAGGEARQPLGLAVVGGLIVLTARHALHHASDLHSTWNASSAGCGPKPRFNWRMCAADGFQVAQPVFRIGFEISCLPSIRSRR